MEKDTDDKEDIKTHERLWLALVVITFLSVIPCTLYLPPNPYCIIWGITFILEMVITVIYSFLNNKHHHDD